MTPPADTIQVRALDQARATLVALTGRVLAFVWVPLLTIHALRFWLHEPVRLALAALQVALVALIAVALWRPRDGQSHWQAIAVITLLFAGLTLSVSVNGLQPVNVAVAVVMVGWATLYFGARGLWGILAGMALVYFAAWLRFAVLGLGAPHPLDLRDREMFALHAALALSAMLLSGYVTKVARDVYESALRREYAALEARAREETARVEAEGQADVLQRRALVFTLAGGLAHDLSNIVQITMGEAELLRRSVNDSASIAAVERIVAAAHMAKRMLRDVVDLGRQSPAGVEGFDAATVITRVSVMLRGAMPPGVRVHWDVEPSCPLAGSELRFEQVIINLALNARDAMPTGGEMRVTLRAESPTRCRLVVADTGSGIPEELQLRIFAPYVTSKPSGSGTGLGLAIVKRAVEDVGGDVGFTSSAAEGTTFTVHWPRPAMS